MFRARPNLVRPSEVSAKVQNRRPITQSRPGKHCPRSANATPRPRTTKAREPGNASRPRNLPRTTADASVRAGKLRPASGRDFIGQIFTLRPRRPTTIRPTPTVPTRPRPDCPADRPARPSQRRGRPEALFEAQTYVFKPGLTLAASRKT
ncbi:unnamed protein product [Microthlaspi erraticum]|uniref:Uncharacterized protein n=1 Tax=Microthlaspi erraticum TaxID=1685480 RepID=A0A6D2HEY8_9BRAS|nr:unnamed protein product [Microthlaspi erraticum]